MKELPDTKIFMKGKILGAKTDLKNLIAYCGKLNLNLTLSNQRGQFYE